LLSTTSIFLSAHIDGSEKLLPDPGEKLTSDLKNANRLKKGLTVFLLISNFAGN